MTGVATQGKVDLFEPTWVSGYRIQYGDGSYWWWYNGGEVRGGMGGGEGDVVFVYFTQRASKLLDMILRVFSRVVRLR